MTLTNPKLERTWIGRESQTRLGQHILSKEREKSPYEEYGITGNDPFDKRLLFCDTLCVERFRIRFVTETTRGGPFLMIFDCP